jgi:hypothetical protein
VTPSSGITAIVVIGVILIILPLAYIHYFLIIELPKKYGYLNFLIMLAAYLILVAAGTLLFSLGLPGLVLFFLLLCIVDSIGVLFLRNEFIADAKKLFRWKSKSVDR